MINYTDAASITRSYYTLVEYINEKKLKHPWLNDSFIPFITFAPNMAILNTAAFPEDPAEIDDIPVIYAGFMLSIIQTITEFVKFSDKSNEEFEERYIKPSQRDNEYNMGQVDPNEEWFKENNRHWRKNLAEVLDAVDALLVKDMEAENAPKILRIGD
jgi:hypothetical protein